MGKKRLRHENLEEEARALEEADELEAELAAVRDMMREKEATEDTDEHQAPKQHLYNKVRWSHGGSGGGRWWW